MQMNRRAAGVGASAGAIAILASVLLQLEGNKLVPYKDSVGIWTVCEGVTGPAVIPGRTYTQEECAGLNEMAAYAHCDPVAKLLPDGTPDQQVAAWCSFAYNIGVSAFQKSTALKMIQDGKLTEACSQMSRYHYAGGKDCNIKENNCLGIVKRRAFERALCEGKVHA